MQKRKAPGGQARGGAKHFQEDNSIPAKFVNRDTGELVAVATILETGESIQKKGEKREHFVQTYYYVKDDKGIVRPTPMAAITELSLAARGVVPLLGMGVADQ